MKPTFLNLIFTTTFVFAAILGCSKEVAQVPHPPRQIAVAVSPFQDRKKISNELFSWISRQAGSDIHILDGWTGLEITAFEVPALNYYNEAGVARRIGQPISKWARWMTNAPDKALAGSAAINLPLVLTRISEDRLSPGQLLILGSPVLQMPDNPQFDFGGPPFRYPSLENLKNPNSPFCSIGKEKTLDPSQVFWLFDGVSTSNWPAKYEEHLCAFVGKFFASRGAALVAFTPDCDVGLRLANSTNPGPLRVSDFPTSGEPAEMIVEGKSTSRMIMNAATSTIAEAVHQQPTVRTQLVPTIVSIDATAQTRSTARTNASTMMRTATNFVPPRLVQIPGNASDYPVAGGDKTGANVAGSVHADFRVFRKPQPEMLRAIQVPPPVNPPWSDTPRATQVLATPPLPAVTAPAPTYPIQTWPPSVTGLSALYAAPVRPYVPLIRPTPTAPRSLFFPQPQPYLVRPSVPYVIQPYVIQSPPCGLIFRQPIGVSVPYILNPGARVCYGGGAIRCVPVHGASRR